MTKCHIACLPYTTMWIKSAQQSHVLLLQYLHIHYTTNLYYKQKAVVLDNNSFIVDLYLYIVVKLALFNIITYNW